MPRSQVVLIGEESIARDSPEYAAGISTQMRQYLPRVTVERHAKYTPPSIHRPREDMPVLYQPEDPTVGFKSGHAIKTPNRTFVVLNPWLHPSDIFVPHVNNYRAARYVSVTSPTQALLPDAPDANVSARLELDGPQTLHRAELRAAIGAMQYRSWNTEGFNSIVIATNSDYVVRGGTEWVWKWAKNGWTNPVDGYPVANRSLWEKFMKEVRKMESVGVEVRFWYISAEWNEAAVELANAGTLRKDVDNTFQKVVGILV
ncbi:SubName: Full=Related to ribonuclease H1, putative-Talaromyces stipitatus {ECO:0000313/EMBL:CCA70527.1} [Serendipita indica DSM 11827]|nr:SubName: Full=Related to ribonuclease H1, putative-Talaromyces stipitatus {ECO:0000313/EMBL:CCA70527.1} [Serendipita indica DSM 11827]